MSTTTTYVGIDVDQKHLHVAMLLPGAKAPEQWQVAHEPKAVQRLAQQLLERSGGELLACYEAGPAGFSLMRRLEAAGVSCQVIAPALIPQRSGDRIKTDRRDARALARLLRAGLLTAVHPPTPEQEAVRDLCRAREDLQADRKRAKHRLQKMLRWRLPRLHQTESAARPCPAGPVQTCSAHCEHRALEERPERRRRNEL